MALTIEEAKTIIFFVINQSPYVVLSRLQGEGLSLRCSSMDFVMQAPYINLIE